jgi:hypothetical protein
MDLLHTLLDFVLHLDRHLVELLAQYGVWIYALLFAVVFAETGLVVVPVLPGDSLLFALGALAALDSGGSLTMPWLCGLLMVAAILGNLANYGLGRAFGAHAFSGRYRLVRVEYLHYTQAFFARHGAMAIVLARYPVNRNSGRLMLISVAIFGLTIIVFGLSTNFWLSLAALLVMGASDMISVYIRQTLVQSETPDAMRGRVSAVSTVFIGASNELGEFESGMMAAAFGTVPSVVIGGIGTLIVVALWATFFPSLRDRDRLLSDHAE